MGHPLLIIILCNENHTYCEQGLPDCTILGRYVMSNSNPATDGELFQEAVSKWRTSREIDVPKMAKKLILIVCKVERVTQGHLKVTSTSNADRFLGACRIIVDEGPGHVIARANDASLLTTAAYWTFQATL